MIKQYYAASLLLLVHQKKNLLFSLSNTGDTSRNTLRSQHRIDIISESFTGASSCVIVREMNRWKEKMMMMITTGSSKPTRLFHQSCLMQQSIRNCARKFQEFRNDYFFLLYYARSMACGLYVYSYILCHVR
jgi:hypothetical protein